MKKIYLHDPCAGVVLVYSSIHFLCRCCSSYSIIRLLIEFKKQAANKLKNHQNPIICF